MPRAKATAWSRAAAVVASSTASACRSAGTSMRVHAVQVWPELRKQLPTPTLTAFARSASGRITLADLPPSSSATFLTVAAATSVTRLPAAVEPVNDTMSTSGCAAIASPTTGYGPVVGEQQHRQRRHLAGLEHDRAAGSQRRRHLRHYLMQRVVPRRDRADHADGFPNDEGVTNHLLEGVRRQQVRVDAEGGNR